MIDVTLDGDRARLGRTMQHWHKVHGAYRAARKETIINFAGSLQAAGDMSDKPMWGNLIQLSGIAHMVNLAYADPKYLVVPEVPIADSVAPSLQETLNRYAQLLSLGDKGRALALDSFAGWGILNVDVGLLPRGVQKRIGQKIGPMCKRVSQDNYLFDGSASSRDDILWEAHFEFVPKRLAQTYEPYLAYNEAGTAGIREFRSTRDSQEGRLYDADRTDARAVEMVRLVHVYFPHTEQVCTWDAYDDQFISVQETPLLCRTWEGHHTGPYALLSMLDIPDNLIPVAKVEGVKELHFLYNELADKTAHQARQAKTNPLYEIGAQRDMDKIDGARDREKVGVANVQRFGSLSIPGPDQSVTAAQLSTYQLFKELVGNLDDTLGLGPTASTARQSELIRSATTASGAESQRRFDRCMESVAYKLAHLILNDATMKLHNRVRVPHSEMYVDYSWGPDITRNPDADDYNITIIPFGRDIRNPQQRLAQINEAIQQILMAAQIVSQGVSLELDKLIEIQAKYRDLPELRELYLGLLPGHQQAKQQSVNMAANKPNGQYTRTNVSERSDQGELTQLMSQIPSEPVHQLVG